MKREYLFRLDVNLLASMIAGRWAKMRKSSVNKATVYFCVRVIGRLWLLL